MVADAVVYHPTYTKLVRFLDSTPKREKSFRLVAYLSRFLGFYLTRMGYSPELIAVVRDLKGHVALIRKGMRFLKPLNHLEAAAKAYDNKLVDPVVRATTVVRNLGYAGYLSLDSIVWFKLLGLVDKKTYPTAGKWASRFWLLGLVAGLVNGVHVINKLSSQDPEKTDANKLYKAKRKLVWDSLDTFIALNSLDILNFTEGDVGLAGTVTSIMGLSDLWAAT